MVQFVPFKLVWSSFTIQAQNPDFQNPWEQCQSHQHCAALNYLKTVYLSQIGVVTFFTKLHSLKKIQLCRSFKNFAECIPEWNASNGDSFWRDLSWVWQTKSWKFANEIFYNIWIKQDKYVINKKIAIYICLLFDL